VDVLINNAGFGTFGFTQEIPIEKDVAMINLHVIGTYQMTRVFLDNMLMRNTGTIINISSVSALQPVIKMNAYASTKAFIRHFSIGLQEELMMQDTKVKVITVCPAAIGNTPFKSQADMDNVKTFNGLVTTTAEEVAQDVWRGFNKGKTLILTGRKARMLYKIQWMIPTWIERYLIKKEVERV